MTSATTSSNSKSTSHHQLKSSSKDQSLSTAIMRSHEFHGLALNNYSKKDFAPRQEFYTYTVFASIIESLSSLPLVFVTSYEGTDEPTNIEYTTAAKAAAANISTLFFASKSRSRALEVEPQVVHTLARRLETYFIKCYADTPELRRILSFSQGHILRRVGVQTRQWASSRTSLVAKVTDFSIKAGVLVPQAARLCGCAQTLWYICSLLAIHIQRRLFAHSWGALRLAMNLVFGSVLVSQVYFMGLTAVLRSTRSPTHWNLLLTGSVVATVLLQLLRTSCTAASAFNYVLPRLVTDTETLHSMRKSLMGIHALREGAVGERISGFSGKVLSGPKIVKIELKSVTVLRNPQRKSEPLLRSLSFSVHAGMNAFILGPSGTGKTSILRLIGEYYPLYHGTIERPLLRRLVYIPKDAFFPFLTLKENLIYPITEKECTVGEDKLLEFLELMGMGDIFSRFEISFDKRMNSLKPNALTASEKKRIALIRVFSNKPMFALLDEATTDLTEDEEAAFYAELKRQNITCITASDNKRLLRFHDYVLNLIPGEKGSEESYIGGCYVAVGSKAAISNILTCSDKALLNKEHVIPY